MRVVYVDQRGDVGSLEDSGLDRTTERHLVILPPPSLTKGHSIAALERDPGLGLVVESLTGCPNRQQLKWLKRALALQRRAWITWPEEGVVECVTTDRLASHGRLRLVIDFYLIVAAPLLRLVSVPR